MANKYEIPFFIDPTKSAEEIAAAKKEHDAMNREIIKRIDMSLHKEGAVEVLDAMMRTPQITQRLFRITPKDRITILDEVTLEADDDKTAKVMEDARTLKRAIVGEECAAEEEKNKEENNKGKGKRAKSGIDAIITYNRHGKKINMPVKAEPFDFFPTNIKDRAQKALALKDLEKRLWSSYEKNKEQTLNANQSTISSPIISIKLPRANLGEFIAMIAEDGNVFSGLPKDANFQDDNIKKIEKFLFFWERDITRQLSKMLFHFINEYTDACASFLMQRDIRIKLPSLESKIKEEYKEKDKDWINSFIKSADNLLEFIDAEREKNLATSTKGDLNEPTENMNLRALINNTREILEAYV